jgi:diguanylate cyclase (GGDEF)-like protein
MIRRCLHVAAGLLLCFLHATGVSAKPESFTVALSSDTYPYMFVNEQDQPDGLIVDYWRNIAEQQQININFVMADWPETVALLNAGKVDFHGGMAFTEERSAAYQLHSINITIYSNVFVHRDLLNVATLSDLTPYAIGVLDNSSHVATLARQLPAAPLRFFNTATQVYDAALTGQLKAFAALDRLPPRYDKYEQLNKQFPLYKKIPLQAIDLVFGVPLNSPYNSLLKDYTEAVTVETLNELERKWLGFAAAKDDTLLLGLAVSNQPYMNVSSQGDPTGLLVDLWRLWSEKTGISVAFVPDNSLNSITSLANRRIDAHIGFPDIDNLNPQLAKAYHIYSFSAAYYQLKSNTQQPLSTGSEARIGVFAYATFFEELQQQYPKVVFSRYPSLETITSATIAGEIDGFFGAEAVMDARLRQLNLWDDFTVSPTTRIYAPLYVFVNKGNTELPEKISEGFNQISLAELEHVEQKWITASELRYFSNFKNNIPLHPDERQWLAQHSPFRVGLISNWPPMEFVDDNGKLVGVSSEVLQLLSQRLNIQFDLRIYENFDTILRDLENGKLDLVTNVAPKPERFSYAHFTEPFWSVKWAVIGHVNSESMESMRQLSGKRVAVFKDYQLANQLADLVENVSVVRINSVKEGIRMLQGNQVDFVLESLEAGSQALTQSNSINLRMQIIDDVPDYPSLIAVRKNYQPLVAILNKGLRSISEAERTQIYQRWFDFEITQGIDGKRVRQIIWQIVAITLVFLTVFTIWNLFLRREVKLRRSAEEKMRFMATHDDLTGLPNRSLLKERIDQALEQHSRHNEMLAVLFIDLDGFKEVNDQYGHDAGDELLLKLAGVMDNCVRKSDTLARFGGDEFVVLLTALLHRDDAAIVAEKILFQLSQPLQLSFAQIKVSASIGIAIYPHDATDSSALLKQADKQMYLAKQHGKNGYSFTEREFS